MASPIEAVLILADAAQASPDGKVSMLGAGWSQTSSPTAPHAVVGLIKVPWDRANIKLPMHLILVDADGGPVLVDVPDGPTKQKIEFEGDLEVGRPPGMPHGSPIDASLAISVGSLPLPPGRYVWDLDLADLHQSISFQVRSA